MWIAGFGGMCSIVVVGWGCWFFFNYYLFIDGSIDLWCGSRRRERERERERINKE